MTRVALLVAVLFVGQPVLANPFGGSRLFVNPSMKYDVSRTFGVGLNFTIAPVKAAQKKLVEQFKQADPTTYEAVVKAAQYIDPKDIKGADGKGISGSDLKAQLLAVGTLTPEQRQMIEDAPIPDDTETATQLFTIMTEPDTTVTFSFEPYLELHFDAIDLTFTMPLAGFSGDDTDFALGNIGFDMRFGHIFGQGVSGGVSYGIQSWAPTATSTASNALGLANLMWSPRYFYEYTTVSPYFVVGGDFSFLTVQANVAYNGMFGVKGDPDLSQVHFLQYGFSASVTAIPSVILSAELSGLADLKDAPAYNSLFLTTGIRLVSSVVDLGVGAQFPLVKADASKHASFSNLNFGSPSDFNIILSATLGI